MKTYQYLAGAAAATLVAVGAVSADAVPAPIGYTDTVPTAPAPAVVKTVGKIFFTANGKKYECTGNVVESKNRDVISTAGSCLLFRAKDGDKGAYVTDLTFAPAYDRGKRPYGTWAARRLAVTSSWENPTPGVGPNDIGFATLKTRMGKHIQDAVGASKAQFRQPGPVGSQNYVIVGYDTGTTGQSTCKGSTDAVFYPILPCQLKDGGQGAPWFVKGVEVTSTLDNENGTNQGSAWDQEALTAFEAAQAR
jgi:hypothetical protein